MDTTIWIQLYGYNYILVCTHKHTNIYRYKHINTSRKCIGGAGGEGARERGSAAARVPWRVRSVLYMHFILVIHMMYIITVIINLTIIDFSIITTIISIIIINIIITIIDMHVQYMYSITRHALKQTSTCVC